MHERVIRLRVVHRQPNVLVHVEGLHVLERQLTLLVVPRTSA